MAESLRSKIDWDAEIERSINENRLILINSDKATERLVINRYDDVFDSIVADTNKLFQKANIKGKWLKSDVIKFNRNITLMDSIKDRLRFTNKWYKTLTKRNITNIYKKEFVKVQDILNDFQLVDDLRFFKPITSKFLDNVLKMDMQGLTYLQRTNKISDAQALAYEEQIRLSQSLGESFSRTVARVRKINDIGKASAVRLVRLTSMTASNVAHLDAYRKSKIVNAWRWSAALDNRTCPICGAQDQKIFSLDQENLIPAHFNCRCSAIPVIDQREWDQRGTENISKGQGETRIARNPQTGKNMFVPGDTTWPTWLKQQSAQTQKDVLGIGKQKLWAQGKIKLQQIAPQRKIVPLSKLINR